MLIVLIGLDMTFKFAKRNLILYDLWKWPPWQNNRNRNADDGSENCENWERQLWQELEQDPIVRAQLLEILREEKEGTQAGPATTEEDGGSEVVEIEAGGAGGGNGNSNGGVLSA